MSPLMKYHQLISRYFHQELSSLSKYTKNRTCILAARVDRLPIPVPSTKTFRNINRLFRFAVKISSLSECHQPQSQVLKISHTRLPDPRDGAETPSFTYPEFLPKFRDTQMEEHNTTVCSVQIKRLPKNE